MAVNKVVYDGATLVDLTGDTVTADNLAAGVKATGADGRKVVGLLPKVTIDSTLNASSTNPVQNKVIKAELDKKVNKTELSTVATTGSYNDLSDRPSIPAAYMLPTASSTVMGGVKIGSNISVNNGTISLTKSNVTSALGYTPPTSDTTYGNATALTAGLMSAADKAKLDKVDADAGGVKLVIYN